MSTPNLKAKIKLCNFKIELHDKNGVYHPGQQITGALIVHVEKPFDTTGIYMRFLGSSHVSNFKRHAHNNEHEYRQHYDRINDKLPIESDEKNNEDSKSPIKYYNNTEVYFDMLQRLWGTEPIEEIDIGYHTIPFSFTLPGKLPTSLETERGYVRYTIMASIGRAKKYDIRIQKIITVISVVDLNTINNLEKFVTKEENVNFGSNLTKKGTVNIHVTINKSGFVPGEEIIFNASIMNATKKSIAQTAVAIICVITYHADGFVKQETKEVHRRIQNAIPPNESDEWTNERLQISSVPPTGFGEGLLVQSEYCVVFTCKSGYGDIEVALPIVIGTIPLQNNFSTFRPEESIPASNLSKINDTEEIPYKARGVIAPAKQTQLAIYMKPSKTAIRMEEKIASKKTEKAHHETRHIIEAFNMSVKYSKKSQYDDVMNAIREKPIFNHNITTA